MNENQYEYRIINSAGLARPIASITDGDAIRRAHQWDHQQDPDDFSAALREAHQDQILTIDHKVIVSVVYTIGGPHLEVEITFSPEGEVLRGRARGFWAGSQAETEIDAATLQGYAESLGLFDESRVKA